VTRLARLAVPTPTTAARQVSRIDVVRCGRHGRAGARRRASGLGPT
jgi:hypothetical protein